MISFATPDREVAERARQVLCLQGLDVWICSSDIRPGTIDWDEAIRQAIAKSTAVVLVATPSAARSRFVKAELVLADHGRIPIIPMWLVGEFWEDCVPLSHVMAQYIDCRGKQLDIGLAHAASAIKALAAAPLESPQDTHEVRPIFSKVRRKLGFVGAGVSLVVASVIGGIYFRRPPMVAGTSAVRIQPSAAPSATVSIDLPGLLDAIGDLDPSAIARGRALVPAERRSEISLALGHALCVSGDWEGCVESYEAALRGNPGYTSDSTLVADLRQLAELWTVSDRVLDVAAHLMGPSGADLLHSVWAACRKTNKSLAEKAKVLLFERQTADHWSAALRVSIKLDEAMAVHDCKRLKEVIELASTEADDRSFTSLTRLRDRRGCGFLGLSDCWMCLRSNVPIDSAWTSSRRSAPVALGGRTPRLTDPRALRSWARTWEMCDDGPAVAGPRASTK